MYNAPVQGSKGSEDSGYLEVTYNVEEEGNVLDT